MCHKLGTCAPGSRDLFAATLKSDHQLLKIKWISIFCHAFVQSAMSRLSVSLAVGVGTSAALCMVRMRRATYSNLALRVRPPVLEMRP